MSRLPAKGLGKLVRAHRAVRGLELIKEALESICAVLEGLFVLRRNLVDSLVLS